VRSRRAQPWQLLKHPGQEEVGSILLSKRPFKLSNRTEQSTEKEAKCHSKTLQSVYIALSSCSKPLQTDLVSSSLKKET